MSSRRLKVPDIKYLLKKFATIGIAEETGNSAFRMWHQTDHISFLITNARNASCTAVRI
jgi:hypothetical protein